jgi:predicted transcriptional regulator
MNLKKIKILVELIDKKATGNPAEVAVKLHVSERMVYSYLEILKTEFHVPIKYNRSLKTYMFAEEGKLDLNWQEEFEKIVKE